VKQPKEAFVDWDLINKIKVKLRSKFKDLNIEIGVQKKSVWKTY
jgi:hypothetical protein